MGFLIYANKYYNIAVLNIPCNQSGIEGRYYFCRCADLDNLENRQK